MTEGFPDSQKQEAWARGEAIDLEDLRTASRATLVVAAADARALRVAADTLARYVAPWSTVSALFANDATLSLRLPRTTMVGWRFRPSLQGGGPLPTAWYNELIHDNSFSMISKRIEHGGRRFTVQNPGPRVYIEAVSERRQWPSAE